MTNNRAKALLEILKSKSNEDERIRAIELHDEERDKQLVDFLMRNTQSTDGIMIDKKDGVKEAWTRIFQLARNELEKK